MRNNNASIGSAAVLDIYKKIGYHKNNESAKSVKNQTIPNSRTSNLSQ
jgi:hypothetical protein